MKTSSKWWDESWNIITGCRKVSTGCKYCYAEAIANRFWRDRSFSDIMFHEDRIMNPFKWKKPRKVFINSMSDTFVCHTTSYHYDFFVKMMGVIEITSEHTYMILTKRPAPMQKYFMRYYEDYKDDLPLNNLWLGVSAENQAALDRWEYLVETRAAVRFLSLGPLIDRVDLFRRYGNHPCHYILDNVDWVIIECESGANRRPCSLDWVLSIIQQCSLANKPVYVKQISIDGKVSTDPEEWEPEFRVRQFPLMLQPMQREVFKQANLFEGEFNDI